MSNKQLITNIETLSETLSEKQLIKFLDIMDTMTVMLDEAKKVTKELKEYDFQPEHKYLH
ncbi:MAG: hypothetical protein ACFHVJ_06245 [Aestuariibacter sp.]